MIEKDVVIIGGGPAGLCAAEMFIDTSLSVLIVDRDHHLGGQLVKQTHKFFGSEKQHAKTRGFHIAKKLIDKISGYPHIETMLGTTVTGLYHDQVLTVIKDSTYQKIKTKALIVATGASEKFLAFENNDLPGIYGAGAIQTLMNVYGIKPDDDVVMIGSGNIGLIVSYQLIQAGVQVKAVVEAQDSIGGYKVHASKLKRLGVPFLMQTTIKKAIGDQKLEAVELVKLDRNFNPVEGSEFQIKTNALCVAVGLSPLSQLMAMIDIKMKYVKELGGLVPALSDEHQSSVKWLFASGDVTGIEEASSAMMEGYLSALGVLKYLDQPHEKHDELFRFYHDQLNLLRDSLYGIKTKEGLEKLKEAIYVE